MAGKQLEARLQLTHSLVNADDSKFYKLNLATVAEAFQTLQKSKELNKKSFIKAVNKIKKRDGIVERAALQAKDWSQLKRSRPP